MALGKGYLLKMVPSG